jgi:hypothetical protein
MYTIDELHDKYPYLKEDGIEITVSKDHYSIILRGRPFANKLSHERIDRLLSDFGFYSRWIQFAVNSLCLNGAHGVEIRQDGSNGELFNWITISFSYDFKIYLQIHENLDRTVRMSPGSMGLPIEQLKSQVRLRIRHEINRLTTAANSLTDTVNIIDFNRNTDTKSI